MKKLSLILLTLLPLLSFAQTNKVAQKQVENLQDSLNVRQRVGTLGIDSVLGIRNITNKTQRFVGNSDDRQTAIYSSGLIFKRATGVNGWSFNLGSLRDIDTSTVISQNGAFGNVDAFSYWYLGGTSYNSAHAIRYTNNKIWFGAPTGSTIPSFSQAFRFTGNALFDNTIQANIPSLGTSATNFLSSNAGVISQRTAAQTLADIGSNILPYYKASISIGSDLNNYYSENGLYYIPSTNSAGISNLPDGSSGKSFYFMVFARGSVGSGQCVQILNETFDENAKDMFYRVNTQFGWTPWRTLSYENIATNNLTIPSSTTRTLTIGSGSSLTLDGSGSIGLGGSGGNPSPTLKSGSSASGVIFGAKSFSYTADLRVDNLTNNRVVSWPDTNGTLAVKTDIHGGIIDDETGFGISEDEYIGWNTGGGLTTKIVTKQSAYTMSARDYTIVCTGVTTWTLTLLDPTDYPNRIIQVSNQMKSGVSVTLDSSTKGYYTDGGGTTLTSTATLDTRGKLYILQSDGTNWILLNPDN